jgi:quercetin dioxygenase-like cupin family protein
VTSKLTSVDGMAVPPARGSLQAFSAGARQLRLVEFTSGEVDPNWCSEGHIGFVLSGALEIDFGGRVVFYTEGDGIFIPSGPSSAHRARSITPGTRLVM